jgi:two-component system chemotaxis response regulator CheB
MRRRTRVLVVDDSVVARRIIGEVLAEDDEIEVVGTAPNGRIALAKIPLVQPDVITLDVDMPELNGLEVLAVVRAQYPKVRVIMVSSLTERGAKVTVDSLILGASDYVAKASRAQSQEEAPAHLKRSLVPKVLALAPRARPLRSQAQTPAAAPRQPAARRVARPPEVVAVGASTGGPNALMAVLTALPADFPVPVLVVQHMPENFTGYLAQRLDAKCGLNVVEAQEGMRPAPGWAYLARGNHHLEVVAGPDGVALQTHQGPLVNSCRPSVDVLFQSVARCFSGAALCVVLTGMGQDGLRGCEAVSAAGGQILVQDQATSVVWGMPGAVAEANLADLVLPADEIGPEVAQRVREARA